jgi:hypothetical protein
LKALPPDNRLSASDRVWPYMAFQKELDGKLLSATDFLTVVRQLAAEEIDLNNEPPGY